MSAESPFVYYGGDIVAVVGKRRFWLIDDKLDAATAWFVSVMCLCKREVDEGRIEGPFTSELAERWARLILIAPRANNVALSDADLARELGVPAEQVTPARAEVGHIPQAFG
jgi:hypothetical protein